MPSETRRSLGFTSSTTDSTWSPTFTTLLGCFIRRLQVISEMWINPSTPGSSSMNAP